MLDWRNYYFKKDQRIIKLDNILANFVWYLWCIYVPRVIKMSSPNINNIILVGCLTAYLSVFIVDINGEIISVASAACVVSTRMSDLGPIWNLLRQVVRQNVLTLIWKSPRFVTFWDNLTLFGPKFDIPGSVKHGWMSG